MPRPTRTTRARLLLAGVHPLILEDSRLQAGEGYEIEALAGRMETWLPDIQRRSPDVLVLDLLNVPSLSVIARIKRSAPACHILVVTGLKNGAANDMALAAGASGILYRMTVSGELQRAVADALSGRRYISPVLGDLSTKERARPPDRSRDLLRNRRFLERLLEKGCTAPHIATALGLPVEVVNRAIVNLGKRASLPERRRSRRSPGTRLSTTHVK